jgi:PEP-CTERM motif
VNGDLTEWGVTLLNNNGSNLRPNTVAPGASSSLCTTPASAVWTCEDTNDNAPNGGLVGPQSGGQDYDVEFLGMARGTGVNANTLFVGIGSGLRPDNGANLYGPGDLFVTVNGVAYVIELGGAAGHTGGAAVGAQTQGADGSYYTLDGNGYTTSVTSLPGQVVGSIWKVADGTTTQTAWATAPTQWQKGLGAVSLGTATVYSTLDSFTQNQHAVIELGIDLGLFPAGNGSTTIQLIWDPSCFNDVLSISGTTPVPEPATMFLGGLGLIAFGYAARRRLFRR